MEQKLKRPWLVAAWPGMGAVGQIAGTALARRLGAEVLAEVDLSDVVDARAIRVRGGVILPTTEARATFRVRRDPEGRRDLILLAADTQPDARLAAYAERLLDVAARYGVERVVTFAAMATPTHPSATPRVFAAATSPTLLAELSEAGAEPLAEGEVSGMNGAFVGEAAARGIPAACLLGEFPFFAASLPNPKSSLAVLETFTKLCGATWDFAELKADAARVEEALKGHFHDLREAARAAEESGDDEAEDDAEDGADAATEAAKDARPAEAAPSGPRPAATAMTREAEARVEALFTQAATDRGKARELKSELDRLGVFARYEDRFLDLFKPAG